MADALVAIFHRIAIEYRDAVRKEDQNALDNLLALAVALDRAYPDEMEEIRKNAPDPG